MRDRDLFSRGLLLPASFIGLTAAFALHPLSVLFRQLRDLDALLRRLIIRLRDLNALFRRLPIRRLLRVIVRPLPVLTVLPGCRTALVRLPGALFGYGLSADAARSFLLYGG